MKELLLISFLLWGTVQAQMNDAVYLNDRSAIYQDVFELVAETGFVDKIINREKIHTIRGN